MSIRMQRPSKMSLVSLRELAISAGPFILLALGLLWLSYLILDPAPPRTVVLATGPEQGAYAEFGKRYVSELARFGIRVELRTTAGAAENRQLLRDPDSGVDIAFMQSGASDVIYAVDEDTSGRSLVSLGNLFLEPVKNRRSPDSVWCYPGYVPARPKSDLPELKSLACVTFCTAPAKMESAPFPKAVDSEVHGRIGSRTDPTASRFPVSSRLANWTGSLSIGLGEL